MNIVCGIVAICLSTFIGYYLSGKWSDRKNFYIDLLNFHNNLLKEVEFSKRTINEIVKDYSEEKDFGKLLKNKFINDKKNNIKIKYLNEEEKVFVESYLSDIGKSDAQVENTFLLKFTDEIKNKTTNAQTLETKYKKLYIKIGFLLGLIIFIIFI